MFMRMQILDLAQKYSVGLQEIFVCLQVVLPRKKILFSRPGHQAIATDSTIVNPFYTVHQKRSYMGTMLKQEGMNLFPNEQNFDLDKSRQKFYHGLKEHHKISNIPKFRCEML